jgi:hypothetical protein
LDQNESAVFSRIGNEEIAIGVGENPVWIESVPVDAEENGHRYGDEK